MILRYRAQILPFIAALILFFIIVMQGQFSVSAFLQVDDKKHTDKAPIRSDLQHTLQNAIKDAEILGPISDDAVFDLVFSLRPQHQEELDSLIVKLHDPNSPLYRNWLTPEEFGERFGRPKTEYDRISNWLRENGFKDVIEWPGRLQINFRGDKRQIGRVFGTAIKRYRKDTEVFYANDREPSLPAEFEDVVDYVGGLENFSRAKPFIQSFNPTLKTMFRMGTVTAIAPKDLQTIYNLDSLIESGNDGAGQQIGIVARSAFKKKDVVVFRSQFGLPPMKPKPLFPFGQVLNQGGLEEMEVLLDIEWAGAAAPGAQIIPVIAPDVLPSLQFFVNRMSQVKLISISFRSCEQRLGTRQVMMFHNLYTQAAAQGQSVFVAAGDTGANDCGDGAGRQVNGFASSPNCVAVGGTNVQARYDDMGNAVGFGSETGWSGSGGGISGIFAKPPYQQDLMSLSDTTQRSMPDVAQLADPAGPGAFIGIKNQIACCIGGTSLAAPIWAGFSSLVAQKVGPLGNFNFKIYAMGEAQSAGTLPPVFNDVVKGDNSANGVRGFSAMPGYDMITGWGSFNGKTFIDNMR